MEPFDDEQATHPEHAALRSRLANALPRASASLHTAGVPGMSYQMMNNPYLHVQPGPFDASAGARLPLPPPSSTHSVFPPLSSMDPTMYDSMNNSTNPSSIGKSPYENHHSYQPSTSPSVVASNKRKLEDQQDTTARIPPAPLYRPFRPGVSSSAFDQAQVSTAAPPVGMFGSLQHPYKPVSQFPRQYVNTEDLQRTRRAAITAKTNANTQESLPRPQPQIFQRAQSQTPAQSRTSSLASSAAINEEKAKAMNHAMSSMERGATRATAAPPGGISPPYDADDPELHQLAFEPDFQSFGMDVLYFMTVADRKKARGRGYKQPIDVYNERLRRPNIETADINLAWIPGPGTHEGEFPWQPICGPAAYIAAIRGELKLRYPSPETLYMQGKEYRSGVEIEIPMLHNKAIRLWAKNDYGETNYGHRRTKSGKEEYMTFLPSQSDWSPSNLPPSAAILEPLKMGKPDVPVFVDRDGEEVLDANNQPHRAFDHILPFHIPASVDGWLLAAWVAEDPRLLWKDIEANMVLKDKEAGRLGDRYAKYRDGLPAMTRSVKTIKTSKTDLKTIREQGHENIVGNSWWFVDLDKELMCQSKDPMTALEENILAYPLPLRRKKGYEYSERMVFVQDALNNENHGGKEAEDGGRSA